MADNANSDAKLRKLALENARDAAAELPDDLTPAQVTRVKSLADSVAGHPSSWGAMSRAGERTAGMSGAHPAVDGLRRAAAEETIGTIQNTTDAVVGKALDGLALEPTTPEIADNVIPLRQQNAGGMEL